MNAKVQEFIDKMKEEEKERELRHKEEEKKLRDKHLISLGLVDKEKSTQTIEYSTNWKNGFDEWDADKKKYYRKVEVNSPIEVTDEEYQEILKYAQLIEKEKEPTKDVERKDTTWADRINVIAKILLPLNIIGGIILCIIFASDSSADVFAWIPIVSALTYCIFWYPIIVGFSKIVKVAEKNLQE